MSTQRLLGGRAVLSEVPRSNRRSLVSLIIGFTVGFCMAELFIFATPQRPELSPYHEGYDLVDALGPAIEIGPHKHPVEDRNMADKLHNETRILCWIMTNPDNHKTKAVSVKRTWGKRCNKLLFVSSQNDPILNQVVVVNVSEGRNTLWGKTKGAFQYIYDNHLDEYDWFLKADDDTYVVVENLRLMLYPYSHDTPIYFGCRFKALVDQGYMSGGAGYVLSREAVRRFIEKAKPNKTLCRQDADGSEDVEMGKCLENVHVAAGDSRDENGRGRFFPFPPENHLFPNLEDKSFWYWKWIYYETDEGLDCCSDYAVAFHYISPKQMYVLDYLIYHLRPFGIINLPEDLPERLGVGETLPPPVAAAPDENTTTPTSLSTKHN